MAGLEDVIRSSAPGGNIGKPLMIALVALLASGVLFKGSNQAGSQAGGQAGNQPSGAHPGSEPGLGALIGGLGALVGTLQSAGLGNVINSWIGSGPNQPVSPGQLGSALGPDIIKTLAQKSGMSEDDLVRELSQILPGVVDKLTPGGQTPTLAELSKLSQL
jgi:uncharacterized protein YidB (DUF937 family)